LADRYDRVAHIRSISETLVTLRLHCARQAGFERQQGIAIRNACDVACNFIEERFAVIIEYVAGDGRRRGAYLDVSKRPALAVHLVRLLPSWRCA